MARKTPIATEQRNPRTRGFDRKSTIDLLRTIHREDARVPEAVTGALPEIARAVDAIAQALRQGGRLFYVGAGTSGRLAALDAAELPPTFGTPARMVQAVIAGGRRALMHAVEGAEDNRTQGIRDLAAARLTHKERRRRNYRQRVNAVRAGRARIRPPPARHHHRYHVESAHPGDPDCEYQYHHSDRAGGYRRIDANEGRHSAENGPEHALYGLNDSHRTRP